MRYVHAIKGSAFAAVTFAVASILIPGAGPSDSVELVLTISTFLFAILAGFYINRLNQRYDTVRELLSQEDAHWLTFYKGAAFYAENFGKRLRELIDIYYIYALDTSDLQYYKRTTPILLQVHNAFAEAEPKDKANNIVGFMIELLSLIEERRNRISMIVKERLRLGQWLMLFILVSIIVYCLFYLQEPTISSRVITTLLTTVLTLVLLIMRDLQEFRLGGEFLGVESGEEIFEVIGKPRYYSAYQLKQGCVEIPGNITEYRLGRHKPGALELDIEHISRTLPS